MPISSASECIDRVMLIKAPSHQWKQSTLNQGLYLLRFFLANFAFAQSTTYRSTAYLSSAVTQASLLDVVPVDPAGCRAPMEASA
jgi:hypothetical protein